MKRRKKRSECSFVKEKKKKKKLELEFILALVVVAASCQLPAARPMASRLSDSFALSQANDSCITLPLSVLIYTASDLQIPLIPRLTHSHTWSFFQGQTSSG